MPTEDDGINEREGGAKMVEIRFRIKFKVESGGEQWLDLSETEARELRRALEGVVGEKRGITYIPYPVHPVPYVPTWQPIWTSREPYTEDPLPGSTYVTCSCLEMLI